MWSSCGREVSIAAERVIQANGPVFSAGDMEAVPVKQFVKHVSKRRSSSRRGFSEDFEVNPPRPPAVQPVHGHQGAGERVGPRGL